MSKRRAELNVLVPIQDILISLFDFPEIGMVLMKFLDPKSLGRCAIVASRWNTFIYKLWDEREFCLLSFQKATKKKELQNVINNIDETKHELKTMQNEVHSATRIITQKYTLPKDPNQPKRPKRYNYASLLFLFKLTI
jgi:hypothetical protein